ncbi:hypothetical protein [Jannaschia formosa]|uniref:hypothetical protein n=1 Tax=Jannaschia formosa TaxID=2259592 RepID=UPI000E1C3BA0|nr:hypothetical protein [Jannaschia formosa]TFL19824.1 hypothetical protein DR046_00300 [Jannaschia formosa]
MAHRVAAAVLCLLSLLAAAPAQAEECPGFYRFVEFGLLDRDGMLRPGGTVLRGIDAEGAPILRTDATVCQAIQGVRRDGPGNPIPIVSEVAFDPALLPLDLGALRLSAHDDLAALTERIAAPHRAALAGAEPVTGPDFLCVSGPAVESCQLASPYGPDFPLVVYCDDAGCEMPALAYDDRIAVSARWDRQATTPEELGPEIRSRIEALRAFLAAQSNRAGR